MKPTILTIRAIGATFAKRTFVPVLILTATILVILVGLTTWLVTLNPWWWLLMFAVISAVCVAVTVLTVLWLTIRSVAPAQNPTQKKAVNDFVDKIQLLSDAIGISKVALLFRIVKDVAAPREDGFIGSLTSASATVKSDYVALVKLFDDRYIDT